MALSPQLLNFKSSGVYRLEFDKSQTANINVETLRLVVGHSRKGPYNTPVLIDSQETFNNVFGSIDKGLEKKGMFFHRSCIEALSRGPILALNLAKFETGVDKAYYQSVSTNGSVDGNTSVSSHGDYDKFFDNDKFMTPSDSATLAEIGNGDNNLLNFVNIKQDSITVIVRQAASVKEFDLTAREWYGEGNVPEYLNEFDRMSDFMVDVFVFKGEFDAVAMSNDPIYSAYFTPKGLIKSKLNEFANLRQVSLIAQYTGSILPGFKDLEGRNLYIESIVNAEARRTGLFCAVDEDAVIDENGTKVDFVGHIADETQDFELLSHVVGQEVHVHHPIQLTGNETITVNGDTLEIEDITSIEASNAIEGEDSLLADVVGEYTTIIDAFWTETTQAVPAVPTSYNNANGTVINLTGNATPILSGNGLTMTIPGANYTASILPGKYLFGGTGNANRLIASVSFTNGNTVITSASGAFVIDSALAANVINIYDTDGVIAAIPQGPALYNQTTGQTLNLWGNVSQYLTNNGETLVIPGGDFTSSFTTNDYLFGGNGAPNVKIDSISYTGGAAGDTLINAATGEQFDPFVVTVIEKFADDGVIAGNPISYNNTTPSLYGLVNNDFPVLSSGNTVLTITNSNPAVFNDYTDPLFVQTVLNTGFLFGGTGVANVEFTAAFVAGVGTVLTAVSGAFDPSITSPGNALDIFADNGVLPATQSTYNNTNGVVVGPLQGWVAPIVSNNGYTLTFNGMDITQSITAGDFLFAGLGNPNAEVISGAFFGSYSTITLDPTGDAYVTEGLLSFYELNIYADNGVTPGTPAVPAQYNTASPSATLTLTNGGAAQLTNGQTVLTIPGAGIYAGGIQLNQFLFAGTGLANAAISSVTTANGVTTIVASAGSTFNSSLNGATTLTVFNSNGVIAGTPAVPAFGTLTLECDANVSNSYTSLTGTTQEFEFLHVSNSRVALYEFGNNYNGVVAPGLNGSTSFTVTYLTSAITNLNPTFVFPIVPGDYVDSTTAGRLARVSRISKKTTNNGANTVFEIFTDITPDYNDRIIKSFENASNHYKTFVLPKAEISVKTISEYLSVLSGGIGLYDALIDKDMIDFRYVVDTFTSFDENGLNNKRNLSQLAKDRQNASAILNAPTIEDFKKSTDPSFTDENGTFDTAYIATGGNQDKNPTKVYALPSINEGANYAFYYGPGLIVSDNGKDIIVPPAAYVANNYMDKYTNALPWSIVAGPRRGVVSGTNVKGTEYSFDKNDRDILEPFGINPIVFQRGTGLTILGNKTAQQSIKSALSSAHVREVLIYIQDGMADILKDYVFEFNNVQTRLEIKTLADSFLESVKQDGGVYEFKNVMDQSNNTNEVIDNNMGIIDTYVEPVKGLEIVVHRTTILNTGEIQSGNLG